MRTEVNLEDHIIVPKLNLKEIKSPDKFVEDCLYNLSKSTLDKSKPLWEIHILNIEVSEDVKAIAIFRIHHSLGDGMSLISLVFALTRKSSDPTALPTIPCPKINTNKSIDRKGFLYLWRLVVGLWMIITLFWNTCMDLLLFIATAWFLKDASPLKSSPTGANVPRRIVYKIFSLDDMQLVKNAIGAVSSMFFYDIIIYLHVYY